MRNPIQIVRVAVNFFRIVGNPNRLTTVFKFNEALLKVSTPTERNQWVEDFSKRGLASNALQERVRLGDIDFGALGKLPESTLGGAYARFMFKSGLNVGAVNGRVNGESDVEYFMSHLYETHDIWHVIAGFDADLVGEAGLMTFTITQYVSHAAPFLIAAILMHTALFKVEMLPRVVGAIADGWRRGKNAKNLVGQDWKSRWNEPLSEVRSQLHVQFAN